MGGEGQEAADGMRVGRIERVDEALWRENVTGGWRDVGICHTPVMCKRSVDFNSFHELINLLQQSIFY